jgi:hypothetical protein
LTAFSNDSSSGRGARGAYRATLVGGDEVAEEVVERFAQLGVVLGQHLAQQAEQQLHVVAKALGTFIPEKVLAASARARSRAARTASRTAW